MAGGGKHPSARSSDESPWLRAVGAVCLLGVVSSTLAIGIGLAVGSRSLRYDAAGDVAFASMVIPYVIMHIHLHLNRNLSAKEKQQWKDQLTSGGLAFVATFFYMLRRSRHFIDTKAR